jgi:hypothetical protein
VKEELVGQKKEVKKMKKIVGLVGLAVFLMFVSGNIAAEECPNGFAELGSDLHDEISSTSQTECADKKVLKDVFHLPAGVPLFLSAIAGLGVVALRGRTR